MGFPNVTLMADMLLTFNGELAENTLVQIENASCQVSPQGQGQGAHVTVAVFGFQESFPPNITSAIEQGKSWGGGVACVIFNRTQQSSPYTWSYLDVIFENEVIFPVAGDYSPSVFIMFDDGSSPVQYTYSQIKVHVLSASEVSAANTNRLNLGLTIAILGFSFIEGFMIIYELLKKEETKTQSEEKPTTTTPAIIKPPPTKSRPNNTVSTSDQPTCVSDEDADERKKRSSENKTKSKPTEATDKP
jgi:hypothetical protein